MAELNEPQGHQKQWQTLSELLQADRLPHAMAFVGPIGIGKGQVAFRLAKEAGCPPTSILHIAPSGTMLKLEQAQEVLSFLSLRSLSHRRFLIIDDAQTMNASFANALLKILEEPPANTHFIFLLPAISQLLPTIRSRLQVVRFFPLIDDVIARRGEWSAPESIELKTRAVAALVDLSQRRRDGLEAMSAEIKERVSAELLAKLFQQFFRDALLVKQEHDGIVHDDCTPSLQAWSAFSKRQILELWNESFQLQQDITANLDRALLFENFYNRGRRILDWPQAVENVHG
jgi:DNA polymerase-3 subunit delta'